MRKYAMALAAVALGLPAFAADKVPEATQDFIDKAAVANQFEIDTSQLALKYGKGADVKKFAQEMIDDHTKIGEEFKSTLTAANITPPVEGLDVTHKAKYAKLRVFTTESGFDGSYISEQLAAHEDAVKLFLQGPRGKRPHAGHKRVRRQDAAQTRTSPRNGERVECKNYELIRR